MRNRAPRIALAVAALLWGIAAAATASAETAPDPRELGRQASDRFWRGEMDELWGRMTPQMRRLFGGADGFEEFHTQVIEQLGTPAALLEEVVESDRGVEVYRRVERSTRGSRAIVTSWGFDGRGRIALLSVQPQQVSPRPAESPSRTTTAGIGRSSPRPTARSWPRSAGSTTIHPAPWTRRTRPATT